MQLLFTLHRQHLTRLAFVLLCYFPALANSAELPASLQAVLLSKILSYEAGYRSKGELSVYVVGNEGVYTAFNKLAKGNNKGLSFNRVEIGTGLPTEKYDLLYINDLGQLQSAIQYAIKHKIALATGLPELVKQGATIGMGTEKGKPKFYLNITISEATGLKWDSKVMRIVTPFD